MLGQKSTVTYKQSNIKIFVNILILKDISSFDQGLIMIHQGFLKIHQDSKVAKLGFVGKVNSTLTKHNFVTLYETNPSNSHFEKEDRKSVV